MVKQPSTVSHHAGVYLFKKGQTPLYIGKAADLKKRLGSYFRKNASEKVRRLREEATALEWIETDSEIEALIREAELIKKHLPKYNVLMRDDKSYFYVAVTREQFPKIFVVHKPRFATVGGSTSDSRRSKRELGRVRVIGPFTSGTALFGTLKLLRRIFPYCTCRERHTRPCWNAQMERCLGFCCSKSNAQNPNDKFQTAYRENIKNVVAVLSGRRRGLAARLKKEMREASRSQEYERAAALRDQMERLEDIFRHRHTLSPLRGTKARVLWPRIEAIVRAVTGAERKISRVEGYDISNISGASATGSMVVFVDGMPAKGEYRKFKIKTVHQASDTGMHKEVMRRRLAHPEWPYPDLIVMDGGKPQLHAALSVWKFQSPIGSETNSKFQKPVMAALAKREEELYTEKASVPVRLDSLPRPVMHFFQRVRDESHRFAKKYHHKLRELSLKN